MKPVRLTTFLLVAFALFMGGKASALPSYLGPSGLMLTPDGQATYFQSFSFSAHFFNLSGALKRYGLEGSGNSFAVNYSPVPALEVGFSTLKTDLSDRANMLNGKLIITSESEVQPFSFAAGVVDALDEQEVSPYFLLSKSLRLSGPMATNQVGLSLNAGYGGGIYDDGILVGGELKLTPQFSLLAEGTKRYVNLGARFTSQGLALDIGFIDVEDIAGGVSYSFFWR